MARNREPSKAVEQEHQNAAIDDLLDGGNEPWIEKLNRGKLKGALAGWFFSGGPSDPLQNPQLLAAEFCAYETKWASDKYRSRIESTIAMHQRSAAERRRAVSAEQAPAATVPAMPEGGVKVRVAQIAEYIFGEHPKDGTAPMKKEALRTHGETEGPVPEMTVDEFDEAFQRVYDTRRSRPRKEGWSLREPYRARLEAINERLRR